MDGSYPVIAVLGASGLIGEAVASFLLREGFPIVAIARRFTRAQKAAFGSNTVECPIVALDEERLAKILAEDRADIVVNCIGVLQDSARGKTGAVHQAFVERLINVLGSQSGRQLLIQLSIPGDECRDRTSFSRTKRQAERAIISGPLPYVILRAGFVIAPAAYGGSALMRALAALPVDLPAREAGRALAPTDVTDITRTIAFVAHRWSEGQRRWNAVWEVMARESSTVGDVMAKFRCHFSGSRARVRMPSFLLTLGAKAGDFVGHLGWVPPIRSTALEEMRRGVAGDPGPWIAATAIEPRSLDAMLNRVQATIQEKWFARLYLLKALVLASLAMFWVASGLIALIPSFSAASEILVSHGFSIGFARASTALTSVLDIGVGIAIAVRQTCRAGLIFGMGLTLFYMASATMLTPDMWIDPLGALVKTVPAIVLMLVAFAILEDRA